MNNINLKRWLSLFLSLVMLFTMLPAPTFAQEADGTGETAAEEIQDITIIDETNDSAEEFVANPTEDETEALSEVPSEITGDSQETEAAAEEESSDPADPSEAQRTAAAEELQSRIDAIVNQYGISVDMSDNDVANTIFVADGDTLEATMNEMDAIDRDAQLLSLDELLTLELDLYEHFRNVWDMLFFPMPVVAVTGVSGVEVTTDNNGSVSESGGTVTATVTGSWTTRKTTTITVTNTSGSTATISFDYTVSNHDSSVSTMDDLAGADSGNYSILLTAGATKTFTVCSKRFTGNTTATATLKNFNVAIAAANSNVTVTFNALGTVKKDGTAIASGSVNSVSSSTGSTFVATPGSNMRFVAWINPADNAVLSTSTSYKLIPTEDVAIEAVFSNPAEAPYFFDKDNSILFKSFDAAIAYATSASNKVISLASDATFPEGTFTVPSGITLLIPFDDANTLYTTKPGYGAASTNFKNGTEVPTAYRTLTLADGANLVVNGVMSLSAKHNYTMGHNTRPMGKVGWIKMQGNANITVNSGGALYVYGYITGPDTSSVLVKNGGTVYECFQIMDWRGGTASFSMNNNENRVFPLSQYYVQNVEIPMTLEAGATEGAVMTVNVAIVGETLTSVPFIGSSAMFRISSGSITKRYDGSTDRLIIDVDGDLSIAAMKINVATGYTLNSASYVLPLNNNITVNINSGTCTVAQDISLLPGSQVNIAEGANFVISEGYNVIAYDKDNWGAFVYPALGVKPLTYAPGRASGVTRTVDKDAEMRVNGTITATAGHLYTTADGGSIYSDASTGKVVTTNATLTTNSNADTTYQVTQADTSVSYTAISVTDAKLKNADGSYVTTDDASNTTYNYDAVHKRWVAGGHSEKSNVSAVEPSCLNDGNIAYSVCTCGVYYVGDTVYTADAYNDAGGVKVKALGHSFTNAPSETVASAETCTANRFVYVKCDNCNVVSDTKTVEIANTALEHDWEVTYTWSGTNEDGTVTAGATLTCTATAVCQNDSSHTETETVSNITGTITTNPTCIEAGQATYEAEFTLAGAEKQTKKVTVKATGHQWGEVSYNWYDNGTKCTAQRKCIIEGCTDDTGAQNVEATISSEITTPATCSAMGTTTYTATFPAEYADWAKNQTNAVEDIPMTDHSLIWVQTETKMQHYQDCQNCDYKTEAENCSGGEATCKVLATCTTCNNTYGSLASHTPEADDGDCTTAIKCSVCGTVTTEAKAEHTPEEDDGDCTTAVKCSVCGTVTTEAKAEHTPEEDDGDCTTAVECSVCGTVTTEAKAEHTPEEDDGDCTTAVNCTVCGTEITAAKASHTPEADDGDCTTAVNCTVCGTEITAAKDAHTPEADDGDCTTAVKCSVCGTVTTEAKTEHTPEEDDGDCTTAVECSVCGTVTTPAKDAHTPEEDDGDCTTAIKCSVCGTVTTEAKAEHTPEEDDGDCTTAVKCSVCGTVTTPAKDAHTPEEDDGDCTTAIKCSVCGTVTTEAKAEHTPEEDDGDCTTAVKCSVCGTVTTEAKAEHTPEEDDGDCTTAVKCSVCGTVTTPAKDAHTPEADDGDCTTAVKCSVCGTVTTPAETAHTPAEDDGDCTTAVKCQNCEKNAVEAKVAHTFTNYVSDGNSTCTKDGTKTAKCDNCDETSAITDEGSALNHSGVTEETQWEKDDVKHWKICPDCDQKVNEAEHTIVDGKCQVCGYIDVCEHSGGKATCKDLAICEKCGEPYGELATEHTPGETREENVSADTLTYDLVYDCQVCGTEIRETKTLVKMVTGPVVALEDSLDLSFRVKKEYLDQIAYIAVIRKDANGHEKDFVTYTEKEWDIISDGRAQITYTGILSFEMTDLFYAYACDSNGVRISNILEGGIRQYAMLAIQTYQNTASQRELVTLCVDLLNYGAAAQEFLRGVTDPKALANYGLTEAQQAFASPAMSDDELKALDKREGDRDTTGFRNSTVSLNNAIVPNLFFLKSFVGTDANKLHAVVTYRTVGGTQKTITIHGRDGKNNGSCLYSYNDDRWIVSLTGISAINGDQLLSCKIYVSDDDILEESEVKASGADTINGFLSRQAIIVRENPTLYSWEQYKIYEMTLRYTLAAKNYFS